MTNRWDRAQWKLLGGDDVEGTVSVYLDYDLGNLSFGFRLERDESWFDFYINLGPMSLSVIYWRVTRVYD